MMADIRSQRPVQWFLQGGTQRFMQRFRQGLGGLGLLVAFAANAHGQTLFARPDTTPDYVSYKHVEECLTAVYRVTEEQLNRGKTVWYDTLLIGEWKQQNKKLGIWEYQDAMTAGRPDSAIQAGKACLSRFNPDTATFKSWPVALQIVEVLLMARRDQDAQRFTHRFLDSMRLWSPTGYKNALQGTLELYVQARPLRYADVKQLHTQLLAAVQGDSLYRSIDADLAFARAAMAVHDTVLFDELAWRAIRNNDATPVEERMASPLSRIRLGALEGLIVRFTQEEGFDSLAVSTVAYHLYRANTVMHRVYGGAPATAASDEVKPIKVPDLLGEYSYTAMTGSSPGPSSNSGLASYTKDGAVQPGTLPVKNRINFISAIAGFCHAESEKRGLQKDRGRRRAYCVEHTTYIRRVRERYPEIEITLLSNTYGHVGLLGPLQPADEADTLAKLFLGQHRVPGRLVIEKTPFFHVESPDGRRIDLLTPLEEALPGRSNFRLNWVVDKEGYVVKVLGGFGSDWFNRVYTILMNRPSK